MLWLVIGLLAAWVVAEVGYLLVGHHPPEPVHSSWGYWTVILASITVIFLATWRRPQRHAWWWVAAGVACWLAGDLVYELGGYGDLDDPPIPNVSDALYLLFYPAVWVGLAMLWETRDGTRRQRVLDGSAVALASAALVAAFTLPLPLQASGLERITLISYPLCDALLIGALTSGLAMDGWRRNASGAALALGLGLFAVADVIFARQSAQGTFVSPSLVDVGWMGGFVVVALAALLPSAHWAAPSAASRRHTIMPTGFGALALGVLAAAPMFDLDASATILAVGALAMVLGRLAITIRENAALIVAASTEARTDQLTGLGNRRALLEDLEQVCQTAQTAALVLFDLNGFKAYNDTFGHPAGDELLARLAKRLQVAMRSGRSYRLGGDEYCVLVTADPADELPLARAALREMGPGYLIDAAYGLAQIPTDAADLETALRVADLRMYEFKRARNVSNTKPLPGSLPSQPTGIRESEA